MVITISSSSAPDGVNSATQIATQFFELCPTFTGENGYR